MAPCNVQGGKPVTPPHPTTLWGEHTETVCGGGQLCAPGGAPAELSLPLGALARLSLVSRMPMQFHFVFILNDITKAQVLAQGSQDCAAQRSGRCSGEPRAREWAKVRDENSHFVLCPVKVVPEASRTFWGKENSILRYYDPGIKAAYEALDRKSVV